MFRNIYDHPMKSDKLLVEIKNAMPTTNGCAVFLGNEDKTFVIYVDQHIGQVLHMVMSGEKKARPLTHDLIQNLLMGFEIDVTHMLINHVDNGTFYARLYLTMKNELGQKVVEIDARPSDSIILCIQNQCPIFVSAEVFDQVEDMTDVLEKILNSDS